MAASLFGDRYAGRLDAWHRVGTVWGDKRMLPSEALQVSGVNYGVAKEPLFICRNGTYLQVDQDGIVRDPTKDDDKFRIWNLVSEKYPLTTASDIFRMFDPVVEKHWPLETMLALGKGQLAVMALNAGEHMVTAKNGKTDTNVLYPTIIVNYQGNVIIRLTITRVVCRNTLLMSEKDALVNIEIAHQGDAMGAIRDVVSMVNEVHLAGKQTMDRLNMWAKEEMPLEETREFLAQVFPLPKRGSRLNLYQAANALEGQSDMAERGRALAERFEGAVTRAAKAQAEAMQVVNWYNDKHPEFANTAYGVVQATTDYISYNYGNPRRTPSVENLLVGDRAELMRRAFTQMKQLVG